MRKSAFRAAIAAVGATALLAASAQAVEIVVGNAEGDPGATVTVAVSLNTQEAQVAGTQNDIGFGADSGIAIAAKANGKPDCSVNPEIDKGGTSFAFQPAGCTAGTDCTGIRALVLALDNVSPIPDGSELYTCKVAIALDATAGDKTLANTNTGASDPDGQALATTGVDGTVTVTGITPPKPVTIVIGNANANAGDTVNVDVSLTTTVDVAGTQNDIAFAAPLAIAAKANGKPDCVVNEAIDKGGTSFAFQPAGCTAGTDCTGIRALVLALDNVSPIPTGSVLYTCKVPVAADAADGEYTLTCSNPGASDPDGGALDTDCTDGTVTVGEVAPSSSLAAAINAEDSVIPLADASAFPDSGVVQIGDEKIIYTGKDGNNLTGAVRGAEGTEPASHDQDAAVTYVGPIPATPTPTVTPTESVPTNTPTASATHTRTTKPTSAGGNDDDGCAIVAPAQSSAAWMLLLPAAALLWLRRRSR